MGFWSQFLPSFQQRKQCRHKLGRDILTWLIPWSTRFSGQWDLFLRFDYIQDILLEFRIYSASLQDIRVSISIYKSVFEEVMDSLQSQEPPNDGSSRLLFLIQQ